MFLGLRRLTFGLLCIVTFLVPWEEMLRIPGFKTGTFVISAAAAAIALAAVALRSSIRRVPLVLVLLAVFVYWCFVSLLWSDDPKRTLDTVTTYLSLLLFIWMVWEFVDSRHRLLWILRSYLMGCGVTLTLLFASYVVGRSTLYPETTRYTGGGLNQNSYALLLDIGIIIAAYLATNTSSKWKTAYWLFVLPGSLSIVLTGSRAGTIGLLVSLGVTFLISWSGSWKARFFLLLLVGLAAWLVPSIVPPTLLERVTEGTGANTFSERRVQWNAGLESWREVPMTGVGAGAFIAAVSSKGYPALVAHNTFVEILVDNGIVGLALMLLIWGRLAHIALHLTRRDRFLWLGAGGVWIVVAMTTSLEYFKITWFLYAWIMLQPVASPPTIHAANASSRLPLCQDTVRRSKSKEASSPVGRDGSI